MRPYSYYEAQYGLPYPKITKQYQYFAYKDGEVRTFSTMKEAKDFSENAERSKVPANKAEYDQALAEYKRCAAIAYDKWLDDLRSEHSDLPQAAFDVLFKYASIAADRTCDEFIAQIEEYREVIDSLILAGYIVLKEQSNEL